MSLLLDALKRAEQEKLAKQGERPPEPERVRAVTAAPANETPSLELAPVTSAAPAQSVPPPLRADSSAAAAAQNVFNAKEAAAAADRSRKGIWLWVGLGVLILALAGAAAYVWFSVASFTPRVAASSRPRPAAIGVAPQSAEPAPKLDILMPPPLQPTAAIQPPGVPEEKSPAPAPVRGDTRDAVAALLREAAAAPPPAAPPVKLAPSAEPKPRIAPEVAEGYAALQNGDVAHARASYGAALAADPGNIDAQLGAATLEARAGNRMLAASHYRKALEGDPRNATAIAGLASLMEPERSDGLESNLRADLARDPRSSQLHYALGNLFASQSRWPEAQAEYFEAHSLDPANADIVFNLAVSLDRLRQPRLAAEYYRRALEAARGGAAQFDPASATRRLAEIR